MKTLKQAMRFIKNLRGSAYWISMVGFVYYFGEPAADRLLTHVGHQQVDILVTMGVRVSYALIMIGAFSLMVRPFYAKLDHLTDVDTNDELRHNNIAAAIVTAGMFLAFGQVAGRVLAAAITP